MLEAKHNEELNFEKEGRIKVTKELTKLQKESLEFNSQIDFLKDKLNLEADLRVNDSKSLQEANNFIENLKSKLETLNNELDKERTGRLKDNKEYAEKIEDLETTLSQKDDYKFKRYSRISEMLPLASTIQLNILENDKENDNDNVNVEADGGSLLKV